MASRRTPASAGVPPAAPGMEAAGWCLLQGVVGEPAMAALRGALDAVVSGTAGAAATVEIRAGTQWIRNLRGALPEADAVADHPAIRGAVETLIGAGARYTDLRMRNPVGASARQSLHVDAAGPVTPGGDLLAQVLLFLDDVTADNGPTHLVPGSHRLTTVPDRRYANPENRHPAEVAILCAAGDALVFSSHVWHRGTANISGRPRRALTYSFSSLGRTGEETLG